MTLEELGTTYVKLGQLLSSRSDLLPDVYTEELGRLVDEVPPTPFAEIEPVIREELGDVFAQVDPEPLATASIAQIHTALLQDGREVVVKVRRPGIEEEVALDLELLRSTADAVEDRPHARRALGTVCKDVVGKTRPKSNGEVQDKLLLSPDRRRRVSRRRSFLTSGECT